MRKKLILAMALILCGTLLFTGCQATTGHYLGAKAEQETVTLLQNAVKAEQHWQDLYVSVDYRVEQQGSLLITQGSFTFSDYPQINLTQVHDFKLKLFLLNKDNIVLDYLDLYRTLGRSLTEEMVFKKTLEISPEVTALSIGYEGSFVDETGARDNIWKLPKRNF